MEPEKAISKIGTASNNRVGDSENLFACDGDENNNKSFSRSVSDVQDNQAPDWRTIAFSDGEVAVNSTPEKRVPNHSLDSTNPSSDLNSTSNDDLSVWSDDESNDIGAGEEEVATPNTQRKVVTLGERQQAECEQHGTQLEGRSQELLNQARLEASQVYSISENPHCAIINLRTCVHNIIWAFRSCDSARDATNWIFNETDGELAAREFVTVQGFHPRSFHAMTNELVPDLRTVDRIRRNTETILKDFSAGKCVRAFYSRVAGFLREFDDVLAALSVRGDLCISELRREMEPSLEKLGYVGFLESAVLSKTKIDFVVLWKSAVMGRLQSRVVVAQRLFAASFLPFVDLTDAWIFEESPFSDVHSEFPLVNSPSELIIRDTERFPEFVHFGNVVDFAESLKLLRKVQEEKKNSYFDCELNRSFLFNNWSKLSKQIEKDPILDGGELVEAVEAAFSRPLTKLKALSRAEVVRQMREEFRLVEQIKALPEIVLFQNSAMNGVVLHVFKSTCRWSDFGESDLKNEFEAALSTYSNARISSLFTVGFECEEEMHDRARVSKDRTPILGTFKVVVSPKWPLSVVVSPDDLVVYSSYSKMLLATRFVNERLNRLKFRSLMKMTRVGKFQQSLLVKSRLVCWCFLSRLEYFLWNGIVNIGYRNLCADLDDVEDFESFEDKHAAFVRHLEGLDLWDSGTKVGKKFAKLMEELFCQAQIVADAWVNQQSLAEFTVEKTHQCLRKCQSVVIKCLILVENFRETRELDIEARQRFLDAFGDKTEWALWRA